MPPFKDEEALIAWVKRNVGRKAKWTAGMEHGEGCIIGYQISGFASARIIFDGHVHPIGADPRNTLLIDAKNRLDKDAKHGGFAWVLPQWITEFVTPVGANAAPEKKMIPDYPHECPRCHGPAYVGFNVRVECKAKCL